MSAVMSSWGTSPGTRPLTWMPYGPHSTASVSVRFFTPALAAAEWAKPGPPVHAYDAPTFTIDPRRAGAEVTPPELATAEERAVQRDVDDGAPGVGRRVLGRHGEVGRGVVDEHLREPERVGRGVERGGDRVGVADVALDGEHGGADLLDRGLTGVEVLGLAAGDHDRRAEASELGRDRLAEPGAGAGHEHRDAVVGAGRQCGCSEGRGWGEADGLGHESSL